MGANFATFANALCHLNATPLSVAVLAPCAWGENLACGGAWQSVLNLATHNTAQRGEFGSEAAKHGKMVFVDKTTHGDTANLLWQVWRKWAVLVGKASTAKMEQCLGGGLLSLVARTFWHAFGLNLKGFSTYFIVVFSHLFAYKRHFLGHCVFVKFLNALFLSFLRLSLIAVFVKTADFVILSVAKNPYFKVQICTLNLWILHQKLSITKFRASLEF